MATSVIRAPQFVLVALLRALLFLFTILMLYTVWKHKLFLNAKFI